MPLAHGQEAAPLRFSKDTPAVPRQARRSHSAHHILKRSLAVASPAGTRRPADREVRVGPTPRARLFVLQAGSGGSHRRQALVIAAGIAVMLHVLAVVTILGAPRLLPGLMGPPPAPPSDLRKEPPTMEMVEDQNRSIGGSTPTPPANPTPPAPPAPPRPPAAQGAPDRSDLPQIASSHDAEAVPPDAPKQQQVQAPKPSPPQRTEAAQPEVDLDPSDDQLGYGRQDYDPRVIPAAPDDRNANKMPPYPAAAGRRGEEGSVEMLVLVSADGTVSSVEVAVSSGHPDLDRTATRAVSHWHFRPAREGGVAVPTQIMQVFNFKIDHR